MIAMPPRVAAFRAWARGCFLVPTMASLIAFGRFLCPPLGRAPTRIYGLPIGSAAMATRIGGVVAAVAADRSTTPRCVLARQPVGRGLADDQPRAGRGGGANQQPDPAKGLSRDWGSGCGSYWWGRVIGGVETMPEACAERAVVDCAADLEQPVGTTP